MLYKSALTTQASGSLGGITASHNRGGQYLRARTVPTDPQSPGQIVVREAFANMAELWKALTPAARDRWDTYASNTPVKNRVGADITLTGRAHFMRANVPRVAAGIPAVALGPTVSGIPSVSPISLSVTAAGGVGAANLAFETSDDWVNSLAAHMMVYCGRPKNETVFFFKGPYILTTVLDGSDVTPPTSPAAFVWPFTTDAGDKLFCQARICLADGRLSGIVRSSAIAS